MKLETAKALAWPWPTKSRHEYCRDCSILMGFCDHTEGYEVIRIPSVEEMLERMPHGALLRRTVTGFSAYYYKAIWGENGTSLSMEFRHTVKETSASEAIALLCIWLRDNNLMKWG